MSQSIEKLDPNLAVTDAAENLAWYDIRHLGVEGRGWNDTESFYDRFPARAKTLVPEAVWNLSRHSAGMFVRFVTDATSLSLRWKLRVNQLAMAHMPATGVSGLDLYVRDAAAGWRWAGIAVPREFPLNTAAIAGPFTPATRQFMLVLPLYNGVESVEIGLPAGSTLSKAPPMTARRPICVYGTSIVHGGCAARPGMAYPAILSRRLDCPQINLGFSGNGRMEEAIAHLMAELDPCAYVLDALPNMTPELVRERVVPFVRILREARPATPIVLVENIVYQNGHLVQARADGHANKNAALREAFAALVSAGTPGLHYVPGAELLGDDGEGTVDGTHPTDVGFARMAARLEPVLAPLVN